MTRLIADVHQWLKDLRFYYRLIHQNEKLMRMRQIRPDKKCAQISNLLSREVRQLTSLSILPIESSTERVALCPTL